MVSDRSPQSRHRHFHKNYLQVVCEHLGEGRDSKGLERGAPYQTTPKRRLKRMQQPQGLILLLSTPGKVLNRILLERMKTAVDNRLRDQQAGFQQDRSCMDHIGTLYASQWNNTWNGTHRSILTLLIMKRPLIM